nr:ATP-binding protein [Nostoc sp. ChiQUE02]MDZ8233979.1 ATP-binding protein [Nostoc sp. ChiQUE02]
MNEVNREKEVSKINIDEAFLSKALHKPTPAIFYDVSNALADFFSDKKVIIEGQNHSFSRSLTYYEEAEHCTLKQKSGIYAQVYTRYYDSNTYSQPENIWYEVSWEDKDIEVLFVTLGDSLRYWIIADSKDIAESFLIAVCEWSEDVRSEIWVFEWGCWEKSGKLFNSIKNATTDNLILKEDLKEKIIYDIDSFFHSKSTYEEYKIPYQRGILLIGTPGNGKTHTVKALINKIKQTCLYVKSFHDDDDIHKIFQHARSCSPCILVLEDIDSLITEDNRSFLLNELDGFAENTGILTLATTNYPEKLDPAIFKRPGRFDRKYYFEPPEENERLAYIDLWNKSQPKPELQLDKEQMKQVAEKTDNFSFAYIKELLISALIYWFNQSEPKQPIIDIVMEQIKSLQEQISSENKKSDQA